jgi:hypothetical protein
MSKIPLNNTTIKPTEMTNNKELTSTHFDNQKRGNINNKQQTGIELLLEQFDRNKIVMYNELGERTKVFTLINNDIVAQSKEMEKEIMIQFAWDVLTNMSGKTSKSFRKIADEMFEKIYGGGER